MKILFFDEFLELYPCVYLRVYLTKKNKYINNFFVVYYRVLGAQFFKSWV